MRDVVIRPLDEADIQEAADFAAEVLATHFHLTYDNLFTRYAYAFPAYPDAAPSDYHGVYRHGKLVSLAHTHSFRLQYGRATVQMLGVDFICTHPAERGKGYAHAVMRELLTVAAEQGSHIVVLHTRNRNVADFFAQFGFTPLWATYSVQVPVKAASKLAQPLELRIATPEDIPTMSALYVDYWQQRVTIARDNALWHWHLEHSGGEVQVIVNATDSVMGYIWHQSDDFSGRVEVVAPTPAALRTCLAYSARRWQRGNHEQFVWAVPPDDVIVPYAQQIVPLTLQALYLPHEGWMGRVVDARAMVDALRPEILAQVQMTANDINPAAVVISPAPDGIAIGLRDIPNSTCHLAWRDFMQILFGSLRPEALAVREPLSEASVALLNTLFPARIAALAPWDWF